MWTRDDGCKIERTGSPGSYTYSVAPDWADRPVNWVSWGDATRFANWLHNGQPTGDQNLNTTEDGSYYLDGATSHDDLIAVVRDPDATWVIPSEDEWYKAAYHYNDGVTGNYYDYPTSSDTMPSNDLIDPDPGNNANFYVDPDDYTIGAPYWRTEVGEFENSESPYGTFDQAGNLWEYIECTPEPWVGMRGGSYPSFPAEDGMSAAERLWGRYPAGEGRETGLRVAEVPPGACRSSYPPRVVADPIWTGPPSCENDADCPDRSVCRNSICYYTYNRFLRINVNNHGHRVAVRIKHAASGATRFVSPEFLAYDLLPNRFGYFALADSGVPEFRLWRYEINVMGCIIVPGPADYLLQAIDLTCDPGNEDHYSAAASIPTARFGDTQGLFPATPPDGVVNIVDVVGAIVAFEGDPSVSIVQYEMTPEVPEPRINISEAVEIIDAFKGSEYRFSAPQDCP